MTEEQLLEAIKDPSKMGELSEAIENEDLPEGYNVSESVTLSILDTPDGPRATVTTDLEDPDRVLFIVTMAQHAIASGAVAFYFDDDEDNPELEEK